jgi:hypothetical protein
MRTDDFVLDFLVGFGLMYSLCLLVDPVGQAIIELVVKL